MLPFAPAGLATLRRTLAWSNSRQAWEERLSALFLLLAGIGIWWIRGRLALSFELLLWAALGLMTAILLRRGWFKFAGPLLFYELVRVARRPRYFIIRAVFPGPLALIICWIYFWSVENRGGSLSFNEMANFSASVFYAFVSVQFLLVVLLTPAYVAGAIAEEKSSRTLEFLLATDLRSREIVVSKLVARLANLTLLILTGLPILSIVQFLGGVDPNLLLASFAATGLTMASLAGYSILNSVLSKRSRDAIATTYLGAIGYVVLSSASWLLLAPGLGLSTFPSTANWASPITLTNCVEVFNAGNPLSAIGELFNSIGVGTHLDDVLPRTLRNYALFHGFIAIAGPFLAILRLRSTAAKHAIGDVRRSSWRLLRLHRPAVGSQPMLWKEIFVEPGLRLGLLGRVVVFILVAASFAPIIILLFYHINDTFFFGPRLARHPSDLAVGVNTWIRFLGTIVACLMLLAVAVRASGCVSNERDRQTLDALLTSPLETSAILFGKWIGSITSVRWAWLWLGTMYALGIVTGGLHIFALGLLVAAWCIYAGVVSMIGMWFSIVCRTTLRATLWTLVATAAAGGGHWLVWLFLYPIAISISQDTRVLEWVAQFQMSLTPPFVLGVVFTFGEDGTNGALSPGNSGTWMGYALLGLFFWMLVILGLWHAARSRFDVITERSQMERERADQGRLTSLPVPALATLNRPNSSGTLVAASASAPAQVDAALHRGSNAPPQ